MPVKPILILLVEDNEDDYIIFRDVLRDSWQETPRPESRPSYELNWASTYDEGLSALKNGPPDVILLDYFLDVGTGLEFFEAARALGCKAPVILLTGQSDHEVDVQAMQAGVDDYLVKDQLNGALLERAIRYALDRARAAQALRQSEVRFRALIENSDEGIVLLAPNAEILYASPAVERILGFTPEEVVGQNAEAMIFPAEKEHLSVQRRELLAKPGATEVWQHQVRHRDGSWRWIESSIANLLHDPSVGAIVSNFRDITERVRAESDLRQSETRYRTLFETNPHPCWVYDCDSLQFLAVNPAAIEHYGYGCEKFLSMTLRDIWRAEDVPRLLDHVKAERKSRTKNEVWKHQRKDGSLIDVEINSSDLSYDGRKARLVVVNDITRARKAQEIMGRSEERYRSLVRASSQMFWLANADASILLSSDWMDFTGQDPSQIHGEGWIGAVHPEERAEVRMAWRSALTSKTVFAVEYRLRRHDGAYHFVATRAVPVLESNGDIREWVAMTTDISGRKSAEAERDRFFTLSLDLLCIASTDGYFKRLNPAFENVLGYSLEELMAEPLLNFVHPDDVQGTTEETARIGSSTVNATFTNRYRCRDGSYRWFSWTTAWRDGLCYATARDITDLKNTQEKLHRSLSLVQATLEATADGILVVDGAGLITDYNRKFLTMWGISDDLMGLGQNQLVFAHAQEQLLEPESFLHTLHTDIQATDADYLLFKDGRVIARYSQPQILDGEDLGRVWSFRDITQRIQARAVQEQLTAQVQQERFHLDEILANVPGIVWEQHFAVEGQAFAKNYVNDYVATLLGYSAEQWLADPHFWNEILHPDDREAATRKRAAIAATGKSDVLEYRLICKDGEAVWVESHCAAIRGEADAVIGLRGVIMDITARKKASEEQARLVILLENTSDFVSWMDTNHKVRYINRAGRQMLGLSPHEEILEAPVAGVHPQRVMETIVHKGLPAAIEHGTWFGETALLRRDGVEIPVSQVIIAPKNEKGEVLFFSTICRDVSQQKKVEAALQKANDELELRVIERTAELEFANHELLVAKEEADAANNAKSEFLSRMSHELRTPLNAILGFGQILEMRGLGAKEEECVAQILRAGHHLLNLINEVLDIARIEAGRLSLSLEPLDVAPLLRESLELVRPLASVRAIQLVNSVEEMAGATGSLTETGLVMEPVMADRQRFHQVMLNLLSNAIKYNPEGGSVTISCYNIEADEWTTHRRVRIEVRDTGPGLSLADQQLVFVPFERLGLEKSKIEGTGIGLALCRQLVNAMNGQIGVQSEIGQGSVFWVELPCAAKLASSLQRSLQISENPVLPEIVASIPPSTVLYIEDTLSNIQLMENLLVEVPQIRLLCARAGDVGLESARQHLPDLILLDLHLPVLEGAQVLKQLQLSPQTRDIPVVILSADATQSQMKKLLTAGAKHYLMKPLEVEQLMRVIGHLLQNKPQDEH